MPEPLIITPELSDTRLFNIKHRVVDAAKHARRLLGPRLGFTDAIYRYTGYQGLSNMDWLYKLALTGQIGMAVSANDPNGREAGLVVAEIGVTATSKKDTKTGIFVTAWQVGKPKYEKDLAILTETGIELAKGLESRLEDHETYDGIFALERVKTEVKSDKNRLARFKDKALTVIEAPVDETALEVLHNVIEGVGFTALATDSWSRSRARAVNKVDEYGNNVRDNLGNYLKEVVQVQASTHPAVLYSLE